jgi:type I restriction enzyme S subunit
MEVKPGYKQTEVGVIPEEWGVLALGDITDCLDSLRVPLNEAQRAKRRGEIPYCGANGVLDYIDDSVVDDDIILIAEDGGYFDEYATRPIAYRMTGKCWVNNHAHILKAKVGTDQGFIYFSLVHKNILRFLASGTRAKLNRAELDKIEVPLPPTKAEQEAIAEALSDADALVESLEQLLAKKHQLKQGAMQELLTGKKRLPGFSGEWKVRSLRNCLLTDPDYGINAPGVPIDGNLPSYLRITDIDDDGRLTNENRVAVNHPLSGNYLLQPNEIVFARTGASVGKSYLYDTADGEMVFAGFLIRVKIDRSKLCPAFLASYTRTRRYWSWVKMMSMRSGQPGINGKEYASLELHLPPSIDEQFAIAAILSDMDAEIAALEGKTAKARQLKQGMMQELLTGRIRLV